MDFDAKKLGSMLTGAGMSLRGRGGEFARQQSYDRELDQREQVRQQLMEKEEREAQEKRDNERRKTFFTDMAGASKLASLGEWGLVEEKFARRLSASQNFPGADFKETQEGYQLAQLAAQGDEQARQQLKKNIDGVVMIGAFTPGSGIYQETGKKIVEVTKDGQVIYQDGGDVFAVPVEGFREAVTGGGDAGMAKFANADLMKDQSGNYFYATRVGDPSTGGTRVEIAAAGHNNPQQGPLVPADSLGNTAPEVVGQRGKETTAAENAKSSAAIAQQSYEQLGAVGKSIASIEQGISALDRGAKTGPIYDLLPSVTEASIALQNVKNQMGLDVVGMSTFGALSESELAFALDTAMPTSLNPGELKSWLVEKKKVQMKLASELRKAAKHFGTGKTIASYIEQMEADGKIKYKPKEQGSQSGGQVIDFGDLP